MILSTDVSDGQRKMAAKVLQELGLFFGKETPLGKCVGIEVSKNFTCFVMFVKENDVFEYSVSAVLNNLHPLREGN